MQTTNRLKVCIAGMSPSCEQAHWDDPTWQKWGLPWHQGYSVRCDRLFEMHDMRLLESEHSGRGENYIQDLKECGIPLYMQEAYFEGVTCYPFQDVAETIGGEYFNSSIAYMMALAIHEEVEEISIFGVDMKGDDEYGYQKPNMEYLIGFARGKGIKVSILEGSPLCKFQNSGIGFYDHMPIYDKRYGWLG